MWGSVSDLAVHRNPVPVLVVPPLLAEERVAAAGPVVVAGTPCACSTAEALGLLPRTVVDATLNRTDLASLGRAGASMTAGRTAGHTDGAGEPTRMDRLRDRYPWLDHVMRAGARYAEKNGHHYAAAITYFSVLALVPLLMIAFAAAGYVLLGHQALLGELRTAIANAAPAGLAPLINSIIDTAISQRYAVGIVGLSVALYSGLAWMGNLREALSAQWDQRGSRPPVVKRLGGDLLAIIGLALMLGVSFAITGIGTSLSRTVLGWLGLGGWGWAQALLVVVGLLVTLVADWLVFVWVVARLPREPVALRSAMRAAVLGAVGLAVLQQVMTVYLAIVTNSPAGVAFGPILGLLVFANIVSRFVLFVAAWAATLHEDHG